MNNIEMPLRVLFLATYFPKPGNELLGPWAMKQAHALLEQGVDVRVVSFTSWVPKFLARSLGAQAYAQCPRQHQWGNLPVEYPRWFVYQIGVLKRWANRSPSNQMRIGWWSARPVLDRIVREFKPHVVFAHHTAVNGYLANRLYQRHGIPFVTSDYDFGEIEDCEKYSDRRRFMDEVATNATQMIAAATRMEHTLRKLFPRARARFVPHGTDPLPKALWRTPRPSELTGKKVVFSLGTFYPRKGFPLLVRAFSRISHRHPSAVLRIAGDGQERSLVEAEIRACHLGERVQLLGFQSHDQAMQELVWADVFALIGWDEPFATVFLEAAAAGCPMVWASDGGIADVLQDGIHGTGILPHDEDAAAAAMDHLLSDDDFRDRCGAAAGKLFLERLTINANAQALTAIFREVAQRDGTDSE